MPTYTIQLPGGKEVDYEGDSPPDSIQYLAILKSQGMAEPQVEPSSGLISGLAKDIPLGLAKGVVGLGESAVGLADIAHRLNPVSALADVAGMDIGSIGNMLGELGYKPKETKQILSGLQSKELRDQQKRVEEAKGFIPTTVELAKNPRAVADLLAESAPSMMGGGAVARTLSKFAPVAGAAIGEGALSAGSMAEAIRQDTGGLTPEQSLIALGSGSATGLLSGVGGAASRKLGLADVDVMIASGRIGRAEGSRLKRAILGAVSEGVIEEMPQSAQEQASKNIATGKPVGRGVPEAAASGMMVGGAMGGGANVLAGGKPAPKSRRDIVASMDSAAGSNTARAASLAAQEIATKPEPYSDPDFNIGDLSVENQARVRAADLAKDPLLSGRKAGEPSAVSGKEDNPLGYYEDLFFIPGEGGQAIQFDPANPMQGVRDITARETAPIGSAETATKPKTAEEVDALFKQQNEEQVIRYWRAKKELDEAEQNAKIKETLAKEQAFKGDTREQNAKDENYAQELAVEVARQEGVPFSDVVNSRANHPNLKAWVEDLESRFVKEYPVSGQPTPRSIGEITQSARSKLRSKNLADYESSVAAKSEQAKINVKAGLGETLEGFQPVEPKAPLEFGEEVVPAPEVQVGQGLDYLMKVKKIQSDLAREGVDLPRETAVKLANLAPEEFVRARQQLIDSVPKSEKPLGGELQLKSLSDLEPGFFPPGQDFPQGTPQRIAAEGLEGWADSVLADNKGVVSMNVDPYLGAAMLVKNGFTIGRKLASTAKDFKDWSGKMVAELGDSIKPHLSDIWSNIKGAYASGGQEGVMMMAKKSGVQTKSANVGRIVKMMGDKLYSADTSKTTGKELFQNAVDAVNARASESGNPRITYGAVKDKFVINDNGPGMTPEKIIEKFLPAGESGKAVGSGGGLGLAKIAILGGNQSWRVITVAKNHNGDMIKTTLTGTGEGYFDYIDNPPVINYSDIYSGMLVRVSDGITMESEFIRPDYTETGTTVEVKTNSPYSAESFVDNAMTHQQNIEGRRVYEKSNSSDQGNEALLSAGYRQSYAKVDRGEETGMFHSIDTPEATIDFIAPKDAKGHDSTYHSIPILNRGILQFDLSINFKDGVSLPKGMSVNIKPKVKAEHEGYPFTTNREDVLVPIKKTIESYLGESGAIRAKEQHERYMNALTDAPSINSNPDMVFLDASGKIGEALVTEIRNDEHVAIALDDVAGIQNAILKKLASKYPNAGFGRAKFAGLMSGGGAYGVHFGKRDAKSPSSIFHDIFLTYKDSMTDALKALKESGGVTQEQINEALPRLTYEYFKAKIAGISLHEALHQTINSEGEDLARALTFKAGDLLDPAINIAESFKKQKTPQEYADIHEKLLEFERTLASSVNEEEARAFFISQGGYQGYATKYNPSDKQGAGAGKQENRGEPASRSATDSAVKWLESKKLSEPGMTFSAETAIIVKSWDLAIDVAIAAIKAGSSIAQATSRAIAEFKKNYPNASNEQIDLLAEEIGEMDSGIKNQREYNQDVWRPLLTDFSKSAIAQRKDAAGSAMRWFGETKVATAIETAAKLMKNAGTVADNIFNVLPAAKGVFSKMNQALSDALVLWTDKSLPPIKEARKVFGDKFDDLSRLLISRTFTRDSTELDALVASTPGGAEILAKIESDKGWGGVRESMFNAEKNVRTESDSFKRQKDYYPLVVADGKLDALLDLISRSDDRHEVEKVLNQAKRDKAKKTDNPGAELTREEQGAVIGKLLFGTLFQGRGAPGFTKKRNIGNITAEMSKLIEPIDVAIETRIMQVAKDVTARQFFGKIDTSGDKILPTDIESTSPFGLVLADAIANKQVTPEGIDVILDNVRDYFSNNRGASSAAWKFGRFIGDMAVYAHLNSFGSAFINASDAFSTAAREGPLASGKALAAAAGYRLSKLPGLSSFAPATYTTLKDIKFHEGAMDTADYMRGNGPIKKFLRDSMKFIQGTMDTFGKEVALNAARINASNVMRTGGDERSFMATRDQQFARIQEVMSKTHPDVWPQMKKSLESEGFAKNDLDDMGRLYLRERLSDAQPMTRAEQAQGKLALHPAFKPIFALKSFMLRQIGTIRNNTYEELKRGNVAAAAAWFGTYALWTMAGQVIVRCMVAKALGKDCGGLDSWLSAFTGIFGMNKYSLSGLTRGDPAGTAVDMITPPLTPVNSLFKDVMLTRDAITGRRVEGTNRPVVRNIGDFLKQAESYKHLPAGKDIYERFGAGRTKELKRQAEEKRGKRPSTITEELGKLILPPPKKSN